MVLLSVVIIAVGVFALKIYLNVQIKSQLDKAAGQLALFGSLNYGDVSTDMDGRISIKNLSFLPFNGSSMPPVITEQINIRTPGLGFLAGFDRKEFPRNMGLSIRGLEVGLFDLSKFSGTSNSISLNPFEAKACGDIEEFTAGDLREMGYDSAKVDLRADYRYQPLDRTITFDIKQNTQNISDIDLKLVVDAPNVNDVVKRNVIPQLALASLRISVDASSFNRRRNAYCALEQNISRIDAIELNIEQAAESLRQSGYEPPPGLIEQYRMFINGNGNWVFTSKPLRSIDLFSLAEKSPKEIFERLQIQAGIGNSASEPMKFERVVSNAQGEWEILKEGEKPEKVKFTKGWQEIPVAQVASHIGSKVSIRTQKQTSYSGTLLSVGAEEIRIESRFNEGRANLPIKKDKITQLSVYLTRPLANNVSDS